MKLRMSQDEIATFEHELKVFNSYVEFGTGGSTVFALRNSKAKVYAVDSDTEWLKNVQAAVPEEQSRLTLHFANIGPTQKWGHPVNKPTETIAASYHNNIWEELELELEQPMLCLVDGRFRMACCLQALTRLKEGSVILFHDFVGRKHFEKHIDLLPIVRFIDTMAYIKVGPPGKITEFQELLQQLYCYPA